MLMTLQRVARELSTTSEHVRQLCIRYERGHDDGIESIDVGMGSSVRQRRISVESLESFKQQRSGRRKVAAVEHRLIEYV
jgi:hypothetical protein